MGKTIKKESSFVNKISLCALCWKYKRTKLSFIQFKVLFLTLIPEDPKVLKGYFAKNVGPRVEPTWAGMLDPPPTDQTGTGPLGRAALHRDDSTLISQFIKLEMKEPTQEQS